MLGIYRAFAPDVLETGQEQHRSRTKVEHRYYTSERILSLARSGLRRAIEKEFLEYQDLRKRGATGFSMLAMMGGLVNVLPQLPPAERRRWEARLRAERFDATSLGQVRAEFDEEFQRVIRIASIGESWEWEEHVLLVTIRVQLDLVLEAMRFIGHPIEASFAEVDLLLRRIAESDSQAAVYASAQAQCKRNWGLPLTNPALEALTRPHALRRSGKEAKTAGDRSHLRFADAAQAAFDFLRFRGFQCVTLTDTFVRYESRRIFVNIYHEHPSLKLRLAMGRRDEPQDDESPFGVESLIRLRDPAAASRFQPRAAGSPELVRLGLEELAASLREHGEAVLRGDRAAIESLADTADQAESELVWGSAAERVAPLAEQAFRRGDYATAARLFASIREGLSSAQARKLQYAQRRSERESS